MKSLRVCIYGGASIQQPHAEFITELACEILDRMGAVIITGGFLHKGNPNEVSTDAAALKGAERYTREHNLNLKDRYEAWLPDPILDKRRKDEGVVRMTATEHGITAREMTGKTPLGRRLAMVAGVDMVVTISGKQHTEVVVEHALELGLPLLTIPDAGGDSMELLENYHERIAANFAPGALDTHLAAISAAMPTDPAAAARSAVDLLRTAKVGKCLVLQPYDEEHNRLYVSKVEPAVARHMVPVRLDHLPTSQAIYDSFADAIRTCSAVIADITVVNHNVMYEIGYAHGCGLTPLIYSRKTIKPPLLPVYFRSLNVRTESPETPIEHLITEYLSSLSPTHNILRSAAAASGRQAATEQPVT